MQLPYSVQAKDSTPLSPSVFNTLMTNYDEGGMVTELVVLYRQGYLDHIKLPFVCMQVFGPIQTRPNKAPRTIQDTWTE